MPVKTSCPYCGVGCGVIADRDAAWRRYRSRRSAASRQFRAAVRERLGARPRPSASMGGCWHPVVNGQEASWDAALDHVAEGFGRIVREHGPDSVAFYVSGQILTEDYYVINKLAKGFIGTANIDTNSRLCMASSRGGSQARVRQRHRSGLLRGSRNRRSSDPGRLQCRLVSSDPVPAHGGRQGRQPGVPHRRHRSAADCDM